MGGLALASGTSAIFYTIIYSAQAGDNIVSANSLYGGTYTQFNDILPKFGIEVRFVDSTDPKNFAAAADEKTRAFFCETCSNPACEVVDLDYGLEGRVVREETVVCVLKCRDRVTVRGVAKVGKQNTSKSRERVRVETKDGARGWVCAEALSGDWAMRAYYCEEGPGADPGGAP